MQPLQPIYNLAEICAQKGVSNAVLCPGSRCAPLTLAFVRNRAIKTWTISDECSAAFIACGLSVHTHTPTVLVCTSGSAPYHFAPAIAESFFQHIPLIVLTADRPVEWIDQWDGQTIRQRNMYGDQVKKAYELPQAYDHPDSLWHINRIINEACNMAMRSPKGPVHINVPLREPLYDATRIHFGRSIRIIEEENTTQLLSRTDVSALKAQLLAHKKIVLVVGQYRHDKKITEQVERFALRYQIPVLAEITSNQHGSQHSIAYADSILEACNAKTKKKLHPELLITLGKSILSKNTKQFIRQYKPEQHWHIQDKGVVADPYQGLTRIIPTSALDFLQQLTKASPSSAQNQRNREQYYQTWHTENQRVKQATNTFFSTSNQCNEFHVVEAILKTLPTTCNLHLANSMPVRYANFIGLDMTKKNVQVFSNRGVSGIDGCSSTAVGHALASKKLTVLITGDMAFFHDRNAFWHNYPLPNLRVIVLNNHGGAIFSVIKGPRKLPELNPYFITDQRLTAEHAAREFGFEYATINTLKNIETVLNNFYTLDGKTKIFEIESNKNIVQKTIHAFKSHIKRHYGSTL